MALLEIQGFVSMKFCMHPSLVWLLVLWLKIEAEDEHNQEASLPVQCSLSIVDVKVCWHDLWNTGIVSCIQRQCIAWWSRDVVRKNHEKLDFLQHVPCWWILIFARLDKIVVTGRVVAEYADKVDFDIVIHHYADEKDYGYDCTIVLFVFFQLKV